MFVIVVAVGTGFATVLRPDSGNWGAAEAVSKLVGVENAGDRFTLENTVLVFTGSVGAIEENHFLEKGCIGAVLEKVEGVGPAIVVRGAEQDETA